MKTQLQIGLLLGCATFGSHLLFAADATKPAFNFKNIDYYHRWSQKDQHEYTPAQQEDLEKWTDMFTVDGYTDVRDGDALAARANAVLGNYKAHQAMVLRTNSVPRTADRPAEHFVAVAFSRPNSIEVAFARFRLSGGKGYALVYSHRIYGEKVGEAMSAWLKENAPATEKALMEWNSIPTPGE
jgi:hypothetical protein